MSGTVSPQDAQPWPTGPDAYRRKRAKRSGRETGCWTYIDGEALERAGLEPGGELPYYTVRGYRRSANGHTAIVSLYREP